MCWKIQQSKDYYNFACWDVGVLVFDCPEMLDYGCTEEPYIKYDCWDQTLRIME